MMRGSWHRQGWRGRRRLRGAEVQRGGRADLGCDSDRRGVCGVGVHHAVAAALKDAASSAGADAGFRCRNCGRCATARRSRRGVRADAGQGDRQGEGAGEGSAPARADAAEGNEFRGNSESPPEGDRASCAAAWGTVVPEAAPAWRRRARHTSHGNANDTPKRVHRNWTQLRQILSYGLESAGPRLARPAADDDASADQQRESRPWPINQAEMAAVAYRARRAALGAALGRCGRRRGHGGGFAGAR